MQCLPLQELRWLVTTAWNRGAVHARFGRTAEAEQYQRWAAGALQYQPQLEEQYQVQWVDWMDCWMDGWIAGWLAVWMAGWPLPGALQF